MKSRLCYSLVILAALKIIITCVCVKTSPLGLHKNDLFSPVQQTSHHMDSEKQGQDGESKKLQIEEIHYIRKLSRLGSRPPNCAHKCRGCVPCDAFQIPATSDFVRVEYTNYEPEGWKCKCGTTFFNP